VGAFPADKIATARRRELLGAVAGIVSGSLVCVGFDLLHGSTLAGMFRAIVLLPARFTTEIVMGVRVPAQAGLCALVALAVAWLVRWRGERLPAWVVPSAELMFACFTLLAVPAHQELLIPYALPFVWLVLVDTRFRAVRLPLVLAAPLQALQVFPVSGSQELMGTSLLIPIAAIALVDGCGALADGLGALADERGALADGRKALAPARVSSRLRLVLAGMLASSLALYVTFVLVQRTRKVSNFYANQDQLPLPGTRWMRFDENIGARARFLADTISGSCDTFLGVRGDNSQYIWTSAKPLTGVIVGNSWKLFDERQQAEMAGALASTPRVLVLDNRALIDAQLRASLPFFQSLQRSFRATAKIGADELCVRGDAPDPKLASCVLLPERELDAHGPHLVVRWPEYLKGPALERVQIADLFQGVLYADSAPPDSRNRPRLWDGDELLFDGTKGHGLPLERLARARDLRLELPQPLRANRASFTRVRFFGANDSRILTLPIVVVLGRQ
jgi:hypothetical protein